MNIIVAFTALLTNHNPRVLGWQKNTKLKSVQQATSKHLLRNRERQDMQRAHRPQFLLLQSCPARNDDFKSGTKNKNKGRPLRRNLSTVKSFGSNSRLASSSIDVESVIACGNRDSFTELRKDSLCGYSHYECKVPEISGPAAEAELHPRHQF